MKRVIFDLFVAGTETTTSSLRWAILLIARNLEVQKRVQAEIDHELGKNKPNYSNRKSLIYTEAVLCEIQRVATLLPFFPHKTTCCVNVRGFTIPENSIVCPNSLAVHRDPKIWKDPEHFNVKNFYDEEKKLLFNTDYLIPFGMGILLLH